MTPFETVKARIATRKKFVSRFAEKERRTARKFLDSSASQILSESTDDTNPDGVIPTDQPEGQANYLTINTLVKTHSVCIEDPDFHVICDDAESADIVREGVKIRWEDYGTIEETRAAFQQHEMCGHGFVWYYWDPEKNWVCFEQDYSWNMAVDPHITTTKWAKPRWAARKLSMPRDEFQKRYPQDAGLVDEQMHSSSDEGLVQQAIDVWVYWDKDTETHIFGEEKMLSEAPNLYGRVPLLSIMGEINPISPWRLGTFDLAAGLQKSISDLQDLLNHQAKHSGTVTAYNSDNMDEEVKSQFENGRPQGAVEIPGGNFDEAFKVFASEGVNPAVMDALTLSLKGLDAATSVNQYMRGVTLDTAKFATEVATVTSTSGSRGLSAQKRYEKLLRQMARLCVTLFAEFAQVVDDDDYLLWQACQAVKDIRVLESSTTYRDPVMEQQSSMQLFKLALQAFEPMAMQGIAPNLPELFMDVLRAWNKKDTEKYLVQIQQPQPAGAPPEAEGEPQDTRTNGAGALPPAMIGAA